MIRFDRAQMRPGFGRELLLGLFEHALPAVDPKRCVLDALACDEEQLRVGSMAFDLSSGRAWAIAIGKAAVPMAEAVSDRLGPHLAAGIAVTRYGHGGAVRGFRVLEAGHPIPDTAGIGAAAAIGELADGAGPQDLVLCLLSGGGSALLASPLEGVSIGDLAETTRILLESGAAIDEVNTVRRHLSTLLGGRLASRLQPSAVVTLLLSDAIGNRPEAIASGPTVPDPSTVDDAIAVLRRRGLWERVPASVRGCLVGHGIEETPKPGDPVFRGSTVQIVGDNRRLLDAVARAGRQAGCRVVRYREPIIGEARDAGRELAVRGLTAAGERARRALLVAGGETTVTVRGRGRGGRNQELALAAALEIAGTDNVCVAALASDGSDGVTDAAGAVVDGATAEFARRAGVNPEAALLDNDAHIPLRAARDLLQTGPTRTNVADVYLAFVDAG